MAQTIHVIEPTLEDEAGHGRSFMGAVMGAGPEQRFEVWAGRRVGALFEDLPQATVHPHFERVRTVDITNMFIIHTLGENKHKI